MSPNHVFSVFFTAVTLKIRSRSPKSIQFFVTSQLYIHENLERIQHIVQTRKCHANDDASGVRNKSICPTPCRLGDKKIAFCRLCSFSTLAYCMDKHIVGGIVFYKHISSLALFLSKKKKK